MQLLLRVIRTIQNAPNKPRHLSTPVLHDAQATGAEEDGLSPAGVVAIRTDGVAGCLRTPRGGSARQILFKAGKGQYFARLLTPRECARLMGAGEYRISGSLNQALFGFGDAVCVPVVEWIAENYLNPVVNELIHGSVLGASRTSRS